MDLQFRADQDPKEQIAFYDDGVGTEQIKLLKVLGGMFGAGLTRNVKELYTSLCRVYEPGDEIFLFGFSRGAFTVRTLAGLIGCCGVIDTRPKDDHGLEKTLTETELKKRVNKAYSRFRQHFRRKASKWLLQFFGRPTAERAAAEFRRDFCVNDSVHARDGRVSIKFMGVWDTVAAVGTPVDELTEVLNFLWPFKFPNLKLGQYVKKACHALAIDDERRTFHPVLWDGSTESKDSTRIEQVWFAGVHSNVGGGYPKQGLSLVALCWMMDKAIEQDLLFAEGVYDRYQALANVDDKLYDSRSGMAIYYRYKPRDIARLCDKHGVEPKVHASVLRRVELGTEGYAPGNLPSAFKVVPQLDTTKSMIELIERVS